MAIDWRISFRRLDDFPLDSSSVFNSFDEADNYAKGKDFEKGVSYLGEIVSVVDTTKEEITVYKISWDNDRITGDTEEKREAEREAEKRNRENWILVEIGSGKGNVADIQSKDNDIKIEISGTTVYLLLNQISNPEYTYNETNKSFTI